MNDDVDLAEEHLAKGFSAFHVVCWFFECLAGKEPLTYLHKSWDEA